MERKAFGIDLGTTYSCISYVDDVTGQPVVVDNQEGENVTPSIVFFESADNVVVGAVAKENAVMEPESTCEFVKRRMGVDKVAITYEGEEYSPEQISALILKKLVHDAEIALDTEIKDVVITCPAYFGIAERTATKNAGEMAGLNVLEIINEPTAAALCYGSLRDVQDKTIMVYDLGGGTFDVTIIKVTPEEIVAVATDGDHQLGGKTWDDLIMAYLEDEFHSQKGDDIEFDLEAQQELRLKAEKAKQQLTQKETSKNVISASGVRASIELTRQNFDNITESKLRTTIDLTHSTMEAAKKKGVERIEEILLVGGSCKMPQVKAAVEKEFPDTKILMFEPNEAVAKGAAIHADDLLKNQQKLQKWIDIWRDTQGNTDVIDIEEGPTVGELEKVINENGGDSVEILGTLGTAKKDKKVDVKKASGSRLVNITSKSFGIQLIDQNEHEYVRNLIFKQDEVPKSVTQTFGTYMADQSSAELIVYETDEESEEFDIGINMPLGTAILELPVHLPAGAPIQITFDLSTDGLLKLSGVDMTSGKAIHAELQAEDAILTEEVKQEQAKVVNKITVI